MPQLQNKQPDIQETNALLGAILQKMGGDGAVQQTAQPTSQPMSQPPPIPASVPVSAGNSQSSGRGFAPEFFSKLGEGDHRTPFGDFLAKMGIPLAATAAGLAAPQTLPGAVGLSSGYNQGRQTAFENQLKKQEQDRKNKLYSSGKGVYQVDPITGELKEVGNVGYRDIVQKGVLSPEQTRNRNMQSPGMLKQEAEQTSDLYNTINANQVKRDSINEALDAASKIQGGRFGKISRDWMKNFDPDNPALGEWQKIKMVLTDAQLMQSMFLKGAISDVENRWLSEAAANDDLTSVPRIKPVLDRMLKSMEAEEKSKKESYQQIYNKDINGSQSPQGQTSSGIKFKVVQ